MKYDISKSTAPVMPKLGKGTECFKLLLSQVSKDMQEPLVPMLFPILGARVSEAVFQYPDNDCKEVCGMMANLVAESGGNKGQLSKLVEAICRDFHQHDDEELDKINEWAKTVKTKSSNSTKPARPEVAIWFPPSDMTNAAFIQNAMMCEKNGRHTQYLNMPEVEMANSICGGHKKVTEMIRNIYDREKAGALRATADGITGKPTLRVNLTLSSTPYAARNFYRNDLLNGTFGRIVFSYKARTERVGRIPRIGRFDDDFYEKLDVYLNRLDNYKGHHIIPPLNRLIDKMAEDMALIGDLTDDDVLFEVSHRALVSAWKAGCIMWMLNNQTWTKSMGNLVEWLVYHDLWSKMQIFGDMLKSKEQYSLENKRQVPQNMLDLLPDTFSEGQLQTVRSSMGKNPEGTKSQLRKWVFRKFTIFSEETKLYTKTEHYLKTHNSQ